MHFRKSAAFAPSIIRWSNTRVIVIKGRIPILSSITTGFFDIFPIPIIATWGGSIIVAKNSPPYLPRLDKCDAGPLFYKSCLSTSLVTFLFCDIFLNIKILINPFNIFKFIIWIYKYIKIEIINYINGRLYIYIWIRF